MTSDLSILNSPAGLRMLQMVTAGFYDRSRIAQWIYETIGREWDTMSEWSKELHNEIFPQTCTWSIGTWEILYGLESIEEDSLQLRRQRLMAKAFYNAPINPEVIRQGVAILTGCNSVTVEDFVAPYTFYVTVNHTNHVENTGDIWRFIYQIKPSHLSFRLFFIQETPVDTTIHLGGTEATIGKITIPPVELEHKPIQMLKNYGTSASVVAITVEEVVTKRDIASVLSTSSQDMRLEETFLPEQILPKEITERISQIGSVQGISYQSLGEVPVTARKITEELVHMVYPTIEVTIENSKEYQSDSKLQSIKEDNNT